MGPLDRWDLTIPEREEVIFRPRAKAGQKQEGRPQNVLQGRAPQMLTCLQITEIGLKCRLCFRRSGWSLTVCPPDKLQEAYAAGPQTTL